MAGSSHGRRLGDHWGDGRGDGWPEARMNEKAARGHLPVLRRAASELAEIFQSRE